MKFDEYEVFAWNQVVYVGKSKNSLGKRTPAGILTPTDPKALMCKI